MLRLNPLYIVLAFVVLTVGVAMPAPASAQIGIRGGISLNDFFGLDSGDTESVRSLSYGLSATVLRLGPVDLVAEGYYRKKGAGWSALDAVQSGDAPVALDSAQVAALISDAGGLAGQTLEFGLDYIEVPLLVRFNLPLIGTGIRPYIQGGPVFGWRIDCGIEVSLAAGGGGGESEAACEDLSRDNIEQTLRERETGMVLGGGFALSVFGGAGAVFIDSRLTRGLSRLSEGTDGTRVKNQSFSVLLGYSFGFH